MSALRKFTEFSVSHSEESPLADLHAGGGVEMFSSGSLPQRDADVSLGEAVGCFSSGSAPSARLSDTVSGNQVGLYSSGSSPVARGSRVAMDAGVATGLFSSGS